MTSCGNRRSTSPLTERQRKGSLVLFEALHAEANVLWKQKQQRERTSVFWLPMYGKRKTLEEEVMMGQTVLWTEWWTSHFSVVTGNRGTSPNQLTPNIAACLTRQNPNPHELYSNSTRQKSEIQRVASRRDKVVRSRWRRQPDGDAIAPGACQTSLSQILEFNNGPQTSK